MASTPKPDPDNAGVGSGKHRNRSLSPSEELPMLRPFPNSKKFSPDGVGRREIALSPTRLPGGGVEETPPLRVYDTSGPYGDESIDIDFTRGLARMREEWIRHRE